MYFLPADRWNRTYLETFWGLWKRVTTLEFCLFIFCWLPYEFNGDILKSNSLLSDLKQLGLDCCNQIVDGHLLYADLCSLLKNND